MSAVFLRVQKFVCAASAIIFIWVPTFAEGKYRATVDLKQNLELPAPFSFSLRSDQVLPYLSSNVSRQELSVRFRVGERIKLIGERFHRSLKQCLQMWRIPPWYRHCVPLLYHRDELILVIGFFYRGMKNGESSEIA